MSFRLLIAAAGCIASLLAVASPMDSEDQRLAFAQNVLGPLRQEIGNSAPPAVRSLDAAVRLAIEASGREEPASLVSPGNRTITIPDAYIAKSLNLARMGQLAIRVKQWGCVGIYRQHMENTGSRSRPEVFLYTAASPAECVLLKSALPVGPMQEELAERELASTLRFAYMHELGHQFHNHSGFVPLPPDVKTRENQCTFLQAMKLKRQLEQDADDFAVSTLAQLGRGREILGIMGQWAITSPPPNAVAPLDSLLGEAISDHPVSMLRWARNVLRAADTPSGSVMNPALAGWLDEVRRLEANARAVAIASGDPFECPK